MRPLFHPGFNMGKNGTGLAAAGLTGLFMLSASAPAAADQFSWLQVDTKLGITHPSLPNNFVFFWMQCDPDAASPSYTAYLDLGWQDLAEGAHPVSLKIDDRTFSLAGTRQFDSHDRTYGIVAPIDNPDPFLTALAEGRRIEVSAAADSFSTDLQGTAAAVAQLRRNCPVP